MQLKGAKVQKAAAAAPAQAAAQVAAPPALAAKVVDWRVECGHHAKDASRPVFVHGNRIEVVPDKDKKKDKVTIAYKNEGSAPPASLTINGQSVAGKSTGQNASSYPFDAEFKGDLDKKRFWMTEFWTAWRDVTVYRIENAPLPLEIRVRNPRRYKLEFKFPAMKASKTGHKYSKAAKEDRFASFEPTHKETKTTIERWAPTRLKVEGTEKTDTRDRTSTGHRYGYGQEKDQPDKPGGPPIVFTIDGVEAKIDLLDAIGKFIELSESFKKIVKTFKENTPQIGWYFEHELQLMQGTLVLEWYWKEHSDHTAFAYVDIYVKMTIVSLKLELGIGVSGLGFKAQLYVQGRGSLDVSLGGRRDVPDAPWAFVFPALAQFVLSVGGRFEAGNLFKADANGKTGIDIRCDMGINRKESSSMFSLDFTGEWTGIEVTVTASGGAYGVGGQVAGWKKRMADRCRLFALPWPSDDKYVPPAVSRDRIRQVVLKELTEGLDLKIATTVRDKWYRLNDYMELDKVADRLADAIDADRNFDRSPEMVDGLADAIRGDLDALAAKNSQRYVLQAQFDEYLVNGLQSRLGAMVPASNALVQAAKTAAAS